MKDGRRPPNSPREEVPQVDKLAMPLILAIDDAPSVLPPPDGLAVDHHRPLRADYCEGEHLPDTLVQLELFLVVVLRVERVKADLVVQHLGHDLGLVSAGRWRSMLRGYGEADALGLGGDASPRCQGVESRRMPGRMTGVERYIGSGKGKWEGVSGEWE